MKALTIAALTALICAADPPPAVVGTVSSSRPLAIDNVSLSPTGSASWPVVEGDELSTEAPTLLTTTDRDVVTFDANSSAKLSRAQTKEAYVFLRKGGLAFDAKSARLMICIGGHLFVPQAQTKGVLRLASNGAVFEHLDSGTFTEDGRRGCGETGTALDQGGTPGAAGAVIPTAGAPGPSAATVAKVATAAAGAAAIAGAAFATGSSSTASSTCVTLGCNANPAPVSTIQP